MWKLLTKWFTESTATTQVAIITQADATIAIEEETVPLNKHKQFTSRAQAIKWFNEYTNFVYYDVSSYEYTMRGIHREPNCPGYFKLGRYAYIDEIAYKLDECLYNPKLQIGYLYKDDTDFPDFENPIRNNELMHKRFLAIKALYDYKQSTYNSRDLCRKQMLHYIGDDLIGPIVE